MPKRLDAVHLGFFATSVATLTDMGASFAIATGDVLKLFIATPPNGNSV